MEDKEAIQALTGDLQWQIDQFPNREIKNAAGHQYVPSRYKPSLEKAIDQGGYAVVEFVRRYLYRPPSDGFDKLEDAKSLDLACESLVDDKHKPYAHLFTISDREAARERLAPHIRAAETREAVREARRDAARAEIRAEGVPSRPDLDLSLRTRDHR